MEAFMQVQFFWIPVCDSAAAAAVLNRVLSQQRVLHVDSQFVQNGQLVGWAVCIQTLAGVETPARPGGTPAQAQEGATASKIDYREVLAADDFSLYSELRVWRKKRAAEEGVPIYAIATNEQLASVAKERPDSKAAIERIKGLGAGRSAKYAEDLLAICRSTAKTMATAR